MSGVKVSVVAAALLVAASAQAATNEVFHLELGDPQRRLVERPLVLDAIVETATGRVLSPDELAAALADSRIVLVGESHTDMNFHVAQLRVIQELVRAGRWVLVGLEMYPYTRQSDLDGWVTRRFTEGGFLNESRWYENWGYNWEYYRDIFLFARDKELPMFALNTPREVVAAVRKEGFEELDEEQAAHVPTEVDFDSDEHRQLFTAMLQSEQDSFHAAMPAEMLEDFYRAQCVWDATFAHNSLRALRGHFDNPKVVLVVLVGSGHLAYDLGVQRQLANWTSLPVTSVIPIPVADEEGEVVKTVRASYADFIWGLPPKTDELFPRLGVSTRGEEDGSRRTVIHVDEESVAARSGFEVGDLLLAIDGRDLPDREALNRIMSEMRWGDTAVFTVRRGEETVELDVAFRRVLDEEKE